MAHQKWVSTSTGARLREESARLNLNTEIRFHLAKDLHRLVDDLLSCRAIEEIAKLAASLENEGYHLRISRNL